MGSVEFNHYCEPEKGTPAKIKHKLRTTYLYTVTGPEYPFEQKRDLS